jgi:hypothetical protein
MYSSWLRSVHVMEVWIHIVSLVAIFLINIFHGSVVYWSTVVLRVISIWVGGKLKEVGKFFWDSFMAVIVSLEHGTCLHHILQLGNPLVSESYQFHVLPYFFV